MAATAADLFDGTVQDCANLLGYQGVRVYPANLRTREPHPICALLSKAEGQPSAADQSLAETFRWYERQLFPADRSPKATGPAQNPAAEQPG